MKYLSILLVLIISTLSISAQNVDESPVYLAYVSVQDRNTSGYDLHVMDVGTQDILHTIATDAQDCPVGFSPDGRYLQFYQDYVNVSQDRLVNIYQLLDMTSGEIIELRDFASGVWSADSTRIAYSEARGDRLSDGPDEIYIYNVNTREEINIDWKYRVNHLQWAGDQLFFTAIEQDDLQDNIRRLYMWDGENSVLVLANMFPEGILYAKINTQGTHALVKLQTETYDGLYSVDLLTKSQIRINLERSMSTIWHPDGRHVMVWNNGEILTLIDMYTGDITPIREDVQDMYYFQLSQDGHYLSYNQRVDNETVMMQIEDIQTGDIVEVGLNHWKDGDDTAWLSDTQFAYSLIPFDEQIRIFGFTDFLEVDMELMLFDVARSEYRQLTDTPNQAELLECFLG